MSIILINGAAQDSISVTDRGLQYGDGLFETMAVLNGEIPLWDKHWQRLTSGCIKLAISCPDKDQLEHEITTLCQHHDNINTERFVIKLIVTRGNGQQGNGPRGYRFAKDLISTRILSTYPWPDHPEEYKTKGVSVRYCSTTLSENKTLAGVKHLNRLEQVLARNEWGDDFQEGLMLNMKGHVVDGTMSNLFMVKDNQLLTPELSTSGVAGVMRQTIIELAQKLSITVKEKNIFQSDLEQADEVFLTNSLFGIWPVKMLTDIQFKLVGNITRRLQNELSESELRRVK